MPHRGTICARCDDDCGVACGPDDTCDGCEECSPVFDWYYNRVVYRYIGESDEILTPLIDAIRSDPPSWPPLAWVVRWSRDGRDPLVAAWNATRNGHDMWILCALLDNHDVGVSFGHILCMTEGPLLNQFEDAIQRERPRWEQPWERIHGAVPPPRLADVMEAARRLT